LNTKSSNFDIKPIALETVPQLKRLLHAVWSITYRDTLGQPLIDELSGDLHADEKLNGEIVDYSKLSLGAFVGDKLIGHVMVVFEEPDNIYVGRLYVDPAFQSKGVGRALMGAAEAGFEGATTATLEVFETSKGAIEFYKKMGYQQVGRNRSSHATPNELFDLHFIKML
jgi:ribosomal protein S18 acetylase RimI-like enzyme